MTMNIVTEDGKRFSPNRDLLNIYPQTIQHTVNCFNAHSWPELDELLSREQVTWEQLCEAMLAYSTALAAPTDDPSIQLEDCLRAAGWFDLPSAARIAVFAMLGTVVTGQFYHAICESTPLGEVPRPMIQVVEQVRAVFAGKGKP